MHVYKPSTCMTDELPREYCNNDYELHFIVSIVYCTYLGTYNLIVCCKVIALILCLNDSAD